MLTARGRALVVLAVLSVALAGAAPPVVAHDSTSANHGVTTTAHQPSADWSQADALTEALMTMSARYQAASSAERKALERSLVTAAAARLQVLAALMENDPGAVLDAALPAAVRSTLPSVVAPYLERDATLEGMLEILHEDSSTGSQYQYYLQSHGVRHSLHFANSPPEHLLTGASVRAHGVQIGNTLALGGGKNVQQVTPAPAPNTLGAQRTLVILVNFTDAAVQPYTPDYARSVVFGTTSQFFTENSFGQTWLTGDVVGWYTIAQSSTVCDTSTIASQASSAATAAGIDLSTYARHVFAFPQSDVCGFWGRSTVGGNPSQSWINGSLELGVAAHELGHGLGLWHSHALDCGTTAVIGTTCGTAEYGDIVDMMGTSNFAHFNAFQKERLGWLNSAATPPIMTVVNEGTYMLEPYELVGTGPKALKVLKSTDASTGKRTWYYVESRQAIGFDTFLANLANTTSNLLNGLLIHLGTEDNGNSSYLLDMTPATPIFYSWYDPALVAGESFTDPGNGVTITTNWVTATGAAVTVRFGAAVAVSSVTVSTDQSSYMRGQTVAITARVSSGGSPVANASVSFTVTKPTGTVVTASATTGTDGTAVYNLRLRKQDPVGAYQAGASAKTTSAVTVFTVK